MHEQTLLYTQNSEIRWQDMDSFQHVNHTIYFVYMQECRINWLKAHNIMMNDSSRAPIVAEISCKYLRPIIYPQQITTDLYFTHKSGRKLHFYQEIRDRNNPNHIFATGHITVVWINTQTGRSIPSPSEYDYILENYIA